MRYVAPILLALLVVLSLVFVPACWRASAKGTRAMEARAMEASAKRASSTGPVSREPLLNAPSQGNMLRWAKRLDQSGNIPTHAMLRMLQQRKVFLMAERKGPSLLGNWKWLGPGNMGGRIKALCIHPTSPSVMWAGSTAGGVFKTTDSGASWSPMNGFAPVVSVACMVLDPWNPDLIYVGTGESLYEDIAGDSKLASLPGAGIFVSSDAGTTWSRLPSTKGVDFKFVNRIAIAPTDSKVLLAATARGIFRSTDSGSTWSNCLPASAMDVDFHPSDPRFAIAGMQDGTVRYTADGGLTWQAATGVPQADRVEVVYARSDPKIAYASVIKSNKLTVYGSLDGGETYALRTQGPGISTPSRSRHSNVIWVDPTEPMTILFGGDHLYRSRDGGRRHARAENSVHPGHHVLVEHPFFNGSTNRIVFNGNDGGIYVTADFRSTDPVWQPLNNNLRVTRLTAAAISSSGAILGITEGNGTIRHAKDAKDAGEWTRAAADVVASLVTDPDDADYVYGVDNGARIHRSTDAGRSFAPIRGSIQDQGPNATPPLALDPNDPNRMYFGGASLWRLDNVKSRDPSWTEVKRALPGREVDHKSLESPFNICTIAVAPLDSNVIWVGHNNGDVYMTITANAAVSTWKKVNAPIQPNRRVSSIAITPTDQKRVYVSFMGYRQDNVWRSLDAGESWTRITGAGTGAGAGALPDTSVSRITLHPVMPKVLLAGTDLGLFYSMDDGLSWATTKTASLLSPVEDLIWKDSRALLVVTRGRGLYTVEVGERATSEALGGGCGKSNKPLLTATPPVMGQSQTWRLTQAPASSPVGMLIARGTPKPFVLGKGCTLHASAPGITVLPVGSTDEDGSWSFDLPIPVAGSILGAVLTAQNAIFCKGGPALGVAELSNGLKVRGGL